MTAPLLEMRDLTIRFGAGAPAVVDGVSLTLEKGQTLALVGESGSGKSLTALSTARLTPEGARFSGSVRLDGQDVLTADAPALRSLRGSKASFIFQEPLTSLNPLHTVEKQISEILQAHQGLGRRAARPRVLELLAQVGVPDPETRLQAYPHQLSGGQRQRVMIAMALANGPDLLVADEPTTALDVTIQAQILELISRLQRQLGMAMLFITHDLGIVRRLANDVCVMKDGKIVERGPTERIFAAPRHPYTQALLAAEPKGAPRAVDPHAPELLAARRLKVWFPIKHGVLRRTVGAVKAVREATLALREGETLGVVGESGSGKTTLGRALLRLERSEGEIRFASTRIDGLSSRALRPKRAAMQMVFQDPFGSLSPRMTIAEIVGEGLDVHAPRAEAAPERRARVASALEEVGLDPASMLDRYPHEFSGGQRQRVAIARAVILKPRLVVLDEPTSALDMTVQTQIVDLLRALQERHGLSYLFISHDLKVVRALAHHLLVMRDGEIVEQGAASDILERPQAPYTQALLAAAFSSNSFGADRAP